MLGDPSNDNAHTLLLGTMVDSNAAINALASDFPTRLRLLRRQQGLSQANLGKLVDLHYTHIGRYERGTSRPSADALQRLSDTLGTSSDFLLDGDTNDAAKANFQDRELLRMFQEVEVLPDDDKKVIKTLIDALLTKKKIAELTQK